MATLRRRRQLAWFDLPPSGKRGLKTAAAHGGRTRPRASKGSPDELQPAVFACVPFVGHDAVRCVPRQLNHVLRTPGFRKRREESEYEEKNGGIVIANEYEAVASPSARCSWAGGGCRSVQ